MKLGKLQCKSNFNKNYVLLLMIENFESNQIVLYFTRGYMMHLESTCHVSNVMCQMSCVTCHVSCVSCHMSVFSHSKTVRARDLQFSHNIHHTLCVLCHMSGVTCQVSHVTCNVSHVTCLNLNF